MIDLGPPDARIAGHKRIWSRIAAFPELPPFERHVAAYLVADAPREVIARELGVTRGTVSTAAWRLQRKLKVTGVAGLTRLAIRRGYIQP